MGPTVVVYATKLTQRAVRKVQLILVPLRSSAEDPLFLQIEYWVALCYCIWKLSLTKSVSNGRYLEQKRERKEKTSE